MKLVIELELMIIALTVVWFDVFGMHRLLLRLIGKQAWDHVKPITCWFCTQYWIGMIVIPVWAFQFDTSLFDLFLLLSLNIVSAKALDKYWGFEVSLKEENKRLESEIRELKRK